MITCRARVLPTVTDVTRPERPFSEADTSEVRDVLFLFDSPGGSLMEGIRMGEYISDIPAIVSA